MGRLSRRKLSFCALAPGTSYFLNGGSVRDDSGKSEATFEFSAMCFILELFSLSLNTNC
jgi:hypothetical protein